MIIQLSRDCESFSTEPLCSLDLSKSSSKMFQVWHRPQSGDIIPLAKLQTLKQNTEPQPQSERTFKDENDEGN